MTITDRRDALAAVFDALEREGCSPRHRGDHIEARCPAHADSNPSLSVSRGDRQPVVLRCHAGCTPEAVAEALGLRLADLCEPTVRPDRQIVATYRYTDEAGELLFETVRYQPKDFRQRRPDRSKAGGYAWSLNGTRRVLYRLPEVLAAIAADEAIYLCEGEKDADAVTRTGSTATTAPMGAGKWRPEYTDTLAGATIVIVCDRDRAGYSHALDVGPALQRAGCTVLIVEPLEGKDVSDHLNAGHALADLQPVTKAQLEEHVGAAPASTDDLPEDTEGDSWQFRDLRPALEGELEATVPTVLLRLDHHGLLYAGCINSVHGGSGVGKSLLAQEAARQQLDAGEHVVWCDFEDANETLIIERLRSLGVDDQAIVDRFHYVNPDEIPGRTMIDRLLEATAELGHVLLVIDSVGESLGLMGLSEDKDLEVDEWKRFLPHRFERAGHTVLLLDHSTKAGDNPLFPSGSKRKRALISGASWLAEVITPFSRTQTGKLKLTCAKDRHGNYARSEIGAWVHVDPTGAHLQIVLEPPSDTPPPSVGADTAVMVRRVLAALKAAGVDGLSLNELRAAVRANAKATNQVIDDAAALAQRLGCITIADAPRGQRKPHRYVRDLSDTDLERLIG